MFKAQNFRCLVCNERRIATQDNFIEQCKWADVINIHGGSSDLLFALMQNYDLSVLNEDKIIIGSSAGAKFLSSYSPNWDGKGLRKGSAILPLNVIVHYGDDKYLEGDANWSDVAMAMTYSPIGFSVVLKENSLIEKIRFDLNLKTNSKLKNIKKEIENN